MSELSARLAYLKGERQTKEIIEAAGVSRETFRKIERGESVKLDTLRDIAKALGADKDQWIDLLAAWLINEAGKDAFQIWIEPKSSSPLREAGISHTAQAMMIFEQLNAEERHQVTIAMQRKEVLACLPAINQVWDKFSQ